MANTPEVNVEKIPTYLNQMLTVLTERLLANINPELKLKQALELEGYINTNASPDAWEISTRFKNSELRSLEYRLYILRYNDKTGLEYYTGPKADPFEVDHPQFVAEIKHYLNHKSNKPIHEILQSEEDRVYRLRDIVYLLVNTQLALKEEETLDPNTTDFEFSPAPLGDTSNKTYAIITNGDVKYALRKINDDKYEITKALRNSPERISYGKGSHYELNRLCKKFEEMTPPKENSNIKPTGKVVQNLKSADNNTNPDEAPKRTSALKQLKAKQLAEEKEKQNNAPKPKSNTMTQPTTQTTRKMDMSDTKPVTNTTTISKFTDLEASVDKSLNLVSQKVTFFIDNKLKNVNENTTVKELGDIKKAMKLLEKLDVTGQMEEKIESYKARYLVALDKMI